MSGRLDRYVRHLTTFAVGKAGAINAALFGGTIESRPIWRKGHSGHWVDPLKIERVKVVENSFNSRIDVDGKDHWCPVERLSGCC